VRDIVLMKLNAVGLRGARDLMPSEVSGGMARRVALARAIALDPDLVMYDEPFAGLDPISLGTAAQLIRRLNDTLGITSIVVSHDLEETFRIADQVIVLANGSIAAQGTPEKCAQSTDPLVHQFVNALPDGPVRFHYPGPERRPTTSAEGLADELVEACRRRLRRAQPAGGLGHGARCSCACWALGAEPAPVRPGARPDPFPGQLLAGHHRRVGLFVGFVLGLQGYYTLQRYGSSEALGLLVALSAGARTRAGGHGAAVRRAAPALRSRPRSA
jgi:hypothetical protein